jgi:RHS repeat-associated protein
VTVFEWDGWTCIRETTAGEQTRYYAPWGELLTFERDGVTYQVVSDALGCVRVVTDETGAVVARMDFDPWGNLLPASFDLVPGGMPYRFVGALGCRWDSATEHIYMRNRWYEPSLQRFVSRDPLGVGNPVQGGSVLSPLSYFPKLPNRKIRKELLSAFVTVRALPPNSPNLYAYVRNNPAGTVDPSGLGDSEEERQTRDFERTCNEIAKCNTTRTAGLIACAAKSAKDREIYMFIGLPPANESKDTMAAIEEQIEREYDACVLKVWKDFANCEFRALRPSWMK